MPKLRGTLVLIGMLTSGASARVDAASAAWDTRFVSYASPTTPRDVLEWRGNLVVASGFYSDVVKTSEVVWIWDGHTWSGLEGLFERTDKVDVRLRGAATWDLDVYRDELVVSASRLNLSRARKDAPLSFFSIGTWNGSRWKRLGGDLPGHVYGVKVVQDEVFANGRFPIGLDESEDRILRWDGTSWENLVGPNSELDRALHVDGQELLATGTLHTHDGRMLTGVSAWDGSDWREVAPSPGAIQAVTRWQGDLVAGTRARAMGQAILHRWTGHAWEPIGGGVQVNVDSTLWYGPRLVSDLRVETNLLRITGSFDLPGHDTIARVATWDGTTWTRDDDGIDFGEITVAGFASWRGSTLIYGAFSFASGRYVHGLALETSDGWRELRRGDALIGHVASMKVDDDRLWVFGNLMAGGGARMAGPVTWDGSTWSEVFPGNVSGQPIGVVDLRGTTYAVGNFEVPVGGLWGEVPVAVLDGDSLGPLLGFDWPDYEALIDAVVWRDRIAIATRARSGEGTSFSRLVLWDGTTLESFDTAERGSIQTLAVYDDRLIVGGSFSEIAGERISRLGAYDGNSWSPVGGGVEGVVSTLEVVDGALVVGGSFDAVGDAVHARSIAHWDGHAWSAIGTGFFRGETGESSPGTALVRDLVIHDGQLVATGFFARAGDVTVNGLAKWDGVAWQPFAQEATDSEVSIQSGQALASYDGSLYVYGTFAVAGGATERRLARWNESSASGQ